jgi:hypothetical protein
MNKKCTSQCVKHITKAIEVLPSTKRTAIGWESRVTEQVYAWTRSQGNEEVLPMSTQVKSISPCTNQFDWNELSPLDQEQQVKWSRCKQDALKTTPFIVHKKTMTNNSSCMMNFWSYIEQYEWPEHLVTRLESQDARIAHQQLREIW